MVLGVGVDLVDINEVRRLMEFENSEFILSTFTKKEQKFAETVSDHRKAEYFAGLFACKEAVFKSIAHLTREKEWDFRFIETLHHEDGAPYININDALQRYMDEAGATGFCVSISNENDYAIAFVVSQN